MSTQANAKTGAPAAHKKKSTCMKRDPNIGEYIEEKTREKLKKKKTHTGKRQTALRACWPHTARILSPPLYAGV